MNCSEVRRYLNLYLDSELSPETMTDMLKHVNGCVSCAARLQSEARLEKRIRESLFQPASGDDDAWKKAVAALKPMRKWTPYAAVAAAVVVVGALALSLFMLTRHRELDLAAALAAHHEKYMAGESPLDITSSDSKEVSAHMTQKLPFPCAAPDTLPMDTRLVGGRLCYLEGAPTAFYVLHKGRSAVTVAVFSAGDLSRFPMVVERFGKEAEVHCTVDGMAFFVIRNETTVLTAVGNISREEIADIGHMFLKR